MSRGLAVSRPARQALPLAISVERPTRADRSRSAAATFTIKKKNNTKSPNEGLADTYSLERSYFSIHLGLKYCHVLKTINTSVFLAALNMSLPEARSFTLHYAGPQEASFMLIMQFPFRGPWPSTAASTAKVLKIEARTLRFRPGRAQTGQTS